MVVHAVLHAGISFSVRTRLFVKDDRLTVRHDQPRPDELDAGLGIGNLAIVLADQARALRDEEILAGWAVIDVFRHLGGDLARQVRLDARDEGGGYDRAGLDDIGRRGRGQAVGADSGRVGWPVQKRQFLVLHILIVASPQ